MSVQTGTMTVAEFSALPEPREGHYELHHGELVLMPPPKWGHTVIQMRLTQLIVGLTAGKGLAGSEIPFRPAPEHEVWVADVGYIAEPRASRANRDDYLEGAPDLVVEVLSPSNTVDEINDKIDTCSNAGCRSFWVVDPKRRQISVTTGDVTRHYTSRFQCEVLKAEIDVAAVFA
jgi:Uma2 family endonuclease